MTNALRLSRSARRSLERDLPEAVASAVWEFISGRYRVIYRILDDEVVVEVVKISHRSGACT